MEIRADRWAVLGGILTEARISWPEEDLPREEEEDYKQHRAEREKSAWLGGADMEKFMSPKVIAAVKGVMQALTPDEVKAIKDELEGGLKESTGAKEAFKKFVDLVKKNPVTAYLATAGAGVATQHFLGMEVPEDVIKLFLLGAAAPFSQAMSNFMGEEGGDKPAPRRTTSPSNPRRDDPTMASYVPGQYKLRPQRESVSKDVEDYVSKEGYPPPREGWQEEDEMGFYLGSEEDYLYQGRQDEEDVAAAQKELHMMGLSPEDIAHLKGAAPGYLTHRQNQDLLRARGLKSEAAVVPVEILQMVMEQALELEGDLDEYVLEMSIDDVTDVLEEAKKKGKKHPPLGKVMRGDTRKFKVYVRDKKTGNIKKVGFGDPKMEIRRDNPKARKSFRARHGCGTPRASDRTKAAYWSCRMWSKKPVSKILKGK